MHSLINGASYDFGYAREWTHGHLVPAAVFAALFLLARRRHWPRWIAIVMAAGAAWAIAGFFIVQWALIPSAPLSLPTPRFLASGAAGTVLDAGAGSGRATLMVLLARPQSRVTALDRFAAGYGIEGNTPDRLLANVRAAGAAERLTIQTGDAREMPLPGNSFDGAVSSYVIDHLGREGTVRALAEVNRVLRPRGEFLLMVINRDRWIAFAYPFLHGHGYFGQMPARTYWIDGLTTAGFEIVEDGTVPGTLYVLARKKGE